MKKSGLILILALFLASCGQTQEKTVQNQKEKQEDKIEVLYFHGKQRCKTCISIEERTKEILENNYAKEMKEGKIVFKEIDFSLKENEAIAEKYKIAWSSLLLIQWKEEKEKVKNLTDFAFSYAYKNPEVFVSGMKEEIDSLLLK